MKSKNQLNWTEQCSFCFKRRRANLKPFSLRYLCRHLKIDFKQLFFECLKKAGSENDILEVKTDLDKAEVNLCSECGKMIEKLTELFQCLEKIQMEVDWWLQGIREVITESEKKTRYFKGGDTINSIWAETIKEVRRSVVDKPAKLSTLKPTLKLERCMEYSVRPEADSSWDVNVFKVEADEELAEMDDDSVPLDYGDDFTAEDGKKSLNEESSDTLNPSGENSKGIKASSKSRRGRKKLPNKIIPNWTRVKGSKQIKCNQCSRAFAGRSSFLKHFRGAHIEKDMYQCHLCPAQYKLHGQLNNHLIEEHGAKLEFLTFQCDIGACDFTSFDSSRLKKHQLKCTGTPHKKIPNRVEKHECEFCPEKFFRERMLNRHKRLIHKEEVLKQQGRIIANGIFLEREGGRRKVQCKICQAILIDSCSFISHFRAAHSGEIYQCHLCGKNFPRRPLLNKHLKHAHNVEPNEKRQLPEEFKCNNGDCNYTTWERKLITNHKIICQGIRREEKIVKFNCEICGKGFGTEFHMKLHKSRVHSGKIFKCEECGKVVKRKESLKSHIENIHLKIKHKCDHIGCDKTFADKRLLSLHRKSCDKSRPSPAIEKPLL